MTDHNPNDPLLADYQRRFLEADDRISCLFSQNQKLSSDDVKLVKELHFIMTEYRRDPFKPILLTKLSYDPAQYQQISQLVVLLQELLPTLKWWRDWKPGALFV